MPVVNPVFRIGTALLLGTMVLGAAAQSQDAPITPVLGDKWTFRYDQKGDTKKAYAYSLQVTAVDGASAWMLGETEEPNARWPRYVWRQDIAGGETVERFEHDAAAAHGAGKKLTDRTKSDRWLQFPLAVGKQYTVRRPWDNGKGFDEFTAKVQAFEKVKVDGVEFDSYRIHFAGTWNGHTGENAKGRVENLVWYAPRAKGFAHWQHSTWSANGSSRTDTTTELVKWEPQLAK